MRRIVTLVAVVALVASFAIGTTALAGKGSQDQDRTRDGIQQQDRDRDCQCDCDEPCDADGDGVCDNCGGHLPIGPDADGDGVPNGQDPDYVPPQDGSGQQNGR